MGEKVIHEVKFVETDDGFRIELIYVDSASSDGSPEQARSHGARVIRMPRSRIACAGWMNVRPTYRFFTRPSE